MSIDKAALFVPRLPEDDVEVPGIGTVRVRGLSRYEVALAQQATGFDAVERRMLRFGMVDPPMTEDDVKRWQQASVYDEIEVVSTRIAELSGLVEGAATAAYKSDGEQPGS